MRKEQLQQLQWSSGPAAPSRSCRCFAACCCFKAGIISTCKYTNKVRVVRASEVDLKALSSDTCRQTVQPGSVLHLFLLLLLLRHPHLQWDRGRWLDLSEGVEVKSRSQCCCLDGINRDQDVIQIREPGEQLKTGDIEETKWLIRKNFMEMLFCQT